MLLAHEMILARVPLFYHLVIIGKACETTFQLLEKNEKQNTFGASYPRDFQSTWKSTSMQEMLCDNKPPYYCLVRDECEKCTNRKAVWAVSANTAPPDLVPGFRSDNRGLSPTSRTASMKQISLSSDIEGMVA